MKNLLKTTVISIAMSSALFAGGMLDDPINYKVSLENIEIEHTSENKIFNWDANIFLGYDLNKLYLYTEGERVDGLTQSENQVVLSKAITPYWDIQYGIAYDKTEQNNNTWGVIALMGMAPYFIQTRAALLIDKNGNFGIRASAEYEAMITQKLVLVPSTEITAYSKDNEDMEIGKGLSSLNVSLRLKYEIKREFAPYIGISINQTFSNTKDMNYINEKNLVSGVSIWF